MCAAKKTVYTEAYDLFGACARVTGVATFSQCRSARSIGILEPVPGQSALCVLMVEQIDQPIGRSRGVIAVSPRRILPSGSLTDFSVV
jgi:hypothetical protein